MLLNLNIDIIQLIDQNQFDKHYTFNDPVKDKRINDIRNYANNYFKYIGFGISVPCGYMAVKQRSIMWGLTGFSAILMMRTL